MGQSKKVVNELDGWFATHPLKPLFPLTMKLLYLLLVGGPLWISRAISMLCFVTCMAPAWAYGLRHYLSSSVVRNISFGPNPRNCLDIYLPHGTENKKTPVVVFVTGGIWIIGYKAWGMFVGRVLSYNGILAVMPDYRNFPQGTVKDMVTDVDASIGWVTKNIEKYGGDSNNIHVMGQSAGAHLGLLTLLLKAKADVQTSNDNQLKMDKDWQVSQIKTFIGVAGPYDVYGLQDYFKSHGLSVNVLNSLMGGEQYMRKFSPHRLIEDDAFFHQFKTPVQSEPVIGESSSEDDSSSTSKISLHLPPMVFLHGTADRCVPYQKTAELVDLMKSVQIPVVMKLYEGKSHTDSIIEDLVYEEDFSQEDMMTDIVHLIGNQKPFPLLSANCSSSGLHATFMKPRPHHYSSKGRNNAIPKILLSLARFFNPF